jgi:hypothetical protein
MQTCFESLGHDQLAMIRKFDVALQLPLLPTDKPEERIRTKWLKVLLDLIGRNLKNLVIQINLLPSHQGINTLVQPALDSLSMLAQAAESYSLSLDFTKWKEAGRSSSRFFQIFAHPVLSSLSLKPIQVLKIVQFDSHFGKRSVNDLHESLDFTVPSIIERSLIDGLGAMKELTALHFTGCTFSDHFNIPYSFSLSVLELDFEGSKDCAHNTNIKLAVSLIRANRESLQELFLKGWSPTQDAMDGTVDMPSLRVLSADLLNAGCVSLPTKALQTPNLTNLALKRACLHEDVYTTLTNTVTSLPKLKYFEIENCNLYDEDEDAVAQFLSLCDAQDIVLKVVSRRDCSGGKITYYDIYGGLYPLMPLARCIQKVAFRLDSGEQEEIPCYEMTILQHLHLFFKHISSDVTTKTAEPGLPSDNLVNFLYCLNAPVLEVLEVDFSSPFIDYLQTFARHIGSGRFSRCFPMCKEIKGSITADVLNVWDSNVHSNHYGYQKPLAV